MRILTVIITCMVLLAPIQFANAHDDDGRSVPMLATVDLSQRHIYVSGSILNNDEIIQVIIPEVPKGHWRVFKAEVNLTTKAWMGWEIEFGESTRHAVDKAKPFSQQFKKIVSVKKRNAIVFVGGKVVPGEPVIKVFDIMQEEDGFVVMSHNRADVDVGINLIEEGFEKLPIRKIVIEADFVK